MAWSYKTGQLFTFTKWQLCTLLFISFQKGKRYWIYLFPKSVYWLSGLFLEFELIGMTFNLIDIGSWSAMETSISYISLSELDKFTTTLSIHGSMRLGLLFVQLGLKYLLSLSRLNKTFLAHQPWILVFTCGQIRLKTVI